MYDTTITVLGNVATKPAQRAMSSGTLTDFRVASTSRRFDKTQDKWVDGDELFVKVSCWRTLGDNVLDSVKVGDPVIVRGRLYSRRFTDDNGVNRYVYEINAMAVGHDLSRGVGQFTKRFSKTDSPAGSLRSATPEFDAIIDSIKGVNEPVPAP